MALKYLKLPLFDDTYYSYSITLEDNKYQLKFLFLERTNTWIFTLKDSRKNTLVSGQRLTPNALLFADYQFENLSGGFFFTPASAVDPEEVANNIVRPSEFYELFYIYNDTTEA